MIIEIGYKSNGKKCYVSCDDEAFICEICNSCIGFDITYVERIEQRNFTHVYVNSIGNDWYQIASGSVCERLNIANALGYVIRTALDTLSQENENIHFIHGACVQFSGKYSCFVGKTKSGKSTLAYLLCQKAGCKYVTDDLICIDKSLNCVPFAKPIFLRSTNYIEDINSCVKIQYQNDIRYCILPTNIIDKETCFQLDNVFIIERDPDSFFEVKKLSDSSAFINIWRNMYTDGFLTQKRNIALQLAKNATVYNIKYRDVSCDILNILEIMK